LPKKPIKPATSFFRYLRDARDDFTRKNQDLKVTEVTKELSKIWNTMSAAEKRKYEEEYDKEMGAWNKEMAKWNEKYGMKEEMNKKKRTKKRSSSTRKRSTSKKMKK